MIRVSLANMMPFHSFGSEGQSLSGLIIHLSLSKKTLGSRK